MSYHHLTIEERGFIAQYHRSGLSLRAIAALLEHSPATISREQRRNRSSSRNRHGIYFPIQADRLAKERRKNSHRRCMIHAALQEYLERKLHETWSPDQIDHRKEGGFKRPAETRGRFNDKGRTIKKRPREVYFCQTIGYWEGDTVESGRNGRRRKSLACFVTLVERASRYYVAIAVPDRKQETVTHAIIEELGSLPPDIVKTITFDRGKEFAGFEEIEERLTCHTYSCDPYYA
jgi:IS30 family transposase